jgi:KipI family sensor histidine kinase inhibitor
MATDPAISSRASTLRLEPLGDQALLVVLGDRIDPGVNDQVHQLAALVGAGGLAGVTDLVPAYATLAVHYDSETWSAAALGAELDRIWQGAAKAALPAPRLVELPVCYGLEFGPDLAEVAAHCGLAEQEIIARHSGAEYRVYMLCFAPGFAYQGGLDPAIAAPRRQTPRLKVPAGSVGIAGMQTGIYPLETPGGWQIIGRSPRCLFRPGQADPCLLRPGDRLRFVPIDLDAYLAFSEERP